MTEQPDHTPDPARLDAFWAGYLATLPPGSIAPAERPPAWYFCDTQPCADELGALVVAGIKTATASLGWVYEVEPAPVPQAGDLSIIITWDGEPLCLIETTDVTTLPFKDVHERHAYEEGEGDRSLAYWRDVHWRFFGRECAEIGREPSEDMPVVCERFRVLYRPQ